MQKTYIVGTPDGREIEIEGPENATAEQVFAEAQRLYQQTVRPPAPVQLPKGLQPGQQSFADTLIEGGTKQLTNIADGVTGFAKEAASRPFTIYDIINRARGNPTSSVPDVLRPTNSAQEMGAGFERMGEYIGASLLTRGGNLSTLARAGTEAATAGTVAAAQTGGDPREMLIQSVTAGIIPLGGAALSRVGSKIQKVAMGATKADIDNGFKASNLLKYRVGGSPQQVADKSAAQIRGLVSQLDAELKAVPGAEVDVLSLFTDVQQELTTDAAKHFGRNASTLKGLDSLLNELQTVTQTGKVNLADAQKMKRSLGLIGSWLEGSRDPEAKGVQIAANALYSKMKTAIEQAGAPGNSIAAINKQLGDLIPIEQVAIRRIPFNDRQNILSLTDVVAMVGASHNPANMWLWVVNNMSKSGRVGNALAVGGRAVARPGTGNVAAGIRGMLEQMESGDH